MNSIVVSSIFVSSRVSLETARSWNTSCHESSRIRSHSIVFLSVVITLRKERLTGSSPACERNGTFASAFLDIEIEYAYLAEYPFNHDNSQSPPVDRISIFRPFNHFWSLSSARPMRRHTIYSAVPTNDFARSTTILGLPV